MKKIYKIAKKLDEATKKFFYILIKYREIFLENTFKTVIKMINFISRNKIYIILDLIQIFFIILIMILVFLTKITYIKLSLFILIIILLIFLKKSISFLKLKKNSGKEEIDEKELLFKQ